MMDSFKIKKGLGRGLSSLIGDTKVNINTNKLLVSDLVRNKLQPRKTLMKKILKSLLTQLRNAGLFNQLLLENLKTRKTNMK